MSKKNKCNGLDCEMCGNAKCPNEEKEKIIDGIDVSECCFYNNGKCDNPNGMACNCINNAVCYFKELKCLQEELDIKEKMLDKFMIGSGETLEKLQKENEKLKEQLNIYMSQYEIKIPNKYRQTLEIIRKEYTNSIFYQCDKTEEECPCYNCIILGQLDRVQNIVKIIDEALNDRN